MRGNVRDAVISARVPKALKDLIRKIVERDLHMNESDFVRDAIREKIERETPQLYRQLLEKGRVGEAS